MQVDVCLKFMATGALMVALGACSHGSGGGNPSAAPSPVNASMAAGNVVGYRWVNSLPEGDVYTRSSSHENMLLLNRLELTYEVSSGPAVEELEKGKDLVERCQKTKNHLLNMSQNQSDSEISRKYFLSRMLADAGSIRFYSNEVELVSQAHDELRSEGIHMKLEIPRLRLNVLEWPSNSLTQEFETDEKGENPMSKKLQILMTGAAQSLTIAEFCDLVSPDFSLGGDLIGFHRQFQVTLSGLDQSRIYPH